MNQKAAKTSDDDELQAQDFESALSELESLVERMETGELSLDESLTAFQRGVALSRHCQQHLDQAQKTIEVLNAPFDPEDAEPLPDMDKDQKA